MQKSLQATAQGHCKHWADEPRPKEHQLVTYKD